MTGITFEQKVLLEQVRCIESGQALSDDSVPIIAGQTAGQPFEKRLHLRAQRLIRQHQLHDDLSHAAGVFRFSSLVAMLLAAALGAVATLTALAGGGTINIYWLLLVLVGFNLLSMVLWLAGVTVRMDNLTSGLLPGAAAWLPRLMSKRDSATGRADSAWLACHFGNGVGKWRASQITQQLWLVYLGTGLACLLLVLVARQFDFVWGTTLLSDASFVRLTTMLGEPLQALGFTTPDTQQVIETRIGAGYPLTAAHRYSWAQFLIGTLLLCGLLPRVLLWVASSVLLRSARRRMALDYYLPYYVQLRQELMPLHGDSQIVDADARPAQPPAAVEPHATQRGLSGHVPPGTQWVAVELGDEVHWPPRQVDAQQILGVVVDRSSLEEAIAKLRTLKEPELAVAIAATRPPDRGLKRSIAALCESADSSWLVLLLQTPETSVAESRLGAWYQLAKECGIPAQQVITHAEQAT